MNRIKQRIALMTPFRPRRAGAGLIVCTLLLALLTGSVLADTVSTSTYVIPEHNWLTPSSDYMLQADYDLLMSMQTPGWEELTTEEWKKQITPQLPKLKKVMNQRWPENRFIRQLQYSIAEASNPIDSGYKVLWLTHWWDEKIGVFFFDCELNWKYIENAELTNGERNQLLDAALAHADRAVRALKLTELQGATSLKNAGNEFEVQLNEIAKVLGGNSLSIWFTNVRMDISPPDENQISQEQREFISLLTPEGYRDQTVAEYQTFLEKNKDRFDPRAYEATLNADYRTVNEAFLELRGYPAYISSATVDFSLMPAWVIRGSICYMYRMDWKTVDPDHITVGERHEAIRKLFTRIRDAATEAMWEASDWESFDKALKERLPLIAQEESTSALTFTVSEVGLELEPLATEEYVHSSPQNVLKAFMTACYHQDTAKMAEVCAPAGADAGIAGETGAREELLNSIIEMKPYQWTFGEVKKESGKDDVVTVALTLYLEPPKGIETPVEESKQVRLTQIDGSWYLLLESFKL